MLKVMANFQNKFAIIGCQRSGTTLLRLILDSHPQIYCLEENESYSKWGCKFILKENGSIPSVVGYHCPQFTEAFVENEKFFAACGHLLFMQRSMIQVVASMLDMGWIRRIPEYRFTHPDFRAYCCKFNLQPDSLLKECAIYWAYKSSMFQRLIDMGYKVHKIMYDDLVTKPEETIRTVLQFLGLPWVSEVLSHHLVKHSGADERGITTGETDSHRSIDAESLTKYKKIFTEDQIVYLERLNQEL